MTKKPKPSSFSRRERQIMDILYKLERACVGQVLAKLADKPSYSTLRAQLRVLEEKGYVRHEDHGRHGSTNPLQATTKGYGVAGKDFHVGIFDLDGPLKLVEKFLIVFLIGVEPAVLQRRHDVVCHESLPRFVDGHDPVEVSGAESLGPAV